MTAFTIPGSSVPGLLVPGEATPGETGNPPVVFEFIGLVPVTYLQYLGPSGTLSPSPGATFQAGQIVLASGWPYQLPVPPHDGRWLLGGNLQGTRIRDWLRHAETARAAAEEAKAAEASAAAARAAEASRVLHASRAMNADRHAALHRGLPWPPPE